MCIDDVYFKMHFMLTFLKAPTSVADTFTASYTLTAQALKNGQKISPQLMFTGIQDGKVRVLFQFFITEIAN